MRKRRTVENYGESGAKNVDCCTCLERKTCDNAQEGKFCGRWHSKESQREGEDPNRKWERGEEVEF